MPSDRGSYLPGPANGIGISAVFRDERPRCLSARDRQRPGSLLSVGYRPHVLGGAGPRPRKIDRERGVVGAWGAATAERERSRRIGRLHLGATRLDGGAPGKPDEPNDDERAGARDHPGGSAAVAGKDTTGETRQPIAITRCEAGDYSPRGERLRRTRGSHDRFA